MDRKEQTRFTIALFAGNPLHLAAINKLRQIPKGSRTKFICKQILLDEPTEKVSPAIYDAIYESVQKAFRAQQCLPSQPEEIQHKDREKAEPRKWKETSSAFFLLCWKERICRDPLF